jgi:hypothetical protein
VRAPRILLALVPVVLVAAACSSSSAVRQADVETQVVAAIEGAGVPAGSFTVACPGDLAGTVGTTMTCSVTKDGTTSEVLLSVTSVEGDTVNFDIEDAPAP